MNGKSTLYVVLSLCVCLVCVSCVVHPRDNKSEETATVERKVRYFSKVQVEAPCNVYYVQSDSLCVKVSGKRDRLSDLVTVHEGDRLIIRLKMFKNNFLISGDDFSDMNVYVYSPDLTDVTLKSSGSFSVEKAVDTDNLSVELTGSGNMSFDRVVCDNLSVELRGSGNIEMDSVRGVTSSVSLLGAGNVKINQYKFADSRFSLLGVGDIDATLNDCNRVECNLMGVGNMNLEGNVRNISQNVKGTGSINTDNLKVTR